MGDQRRFSADGPRALEEGECLPSGQPKVIRNPQEVTITAAAKYQPLIPLDQHDRLLETLDARAGTQRGKPRSRDPERNPLGGRVYDLACNWPMYRVPHGQHFRYTCGLYQQTHASQCSHNHVDGEQAVKFVLATIQQRILSTGMLAKLEQRIRQGLADAHSNHEQTDRQNKIQSDLASVQSDLETVRKNLSRAKSDEQYKAISDEFDVLVAREKMLLADLAKAQEQKPQMNNEQMVKKAMELATSLPELAKSPTNFGDLGRLFSAVNAQMFLRFVPIQKKRRIEQKLGGGIITLGDAASQ